MSVETGPSGAIVAGPSVSGPGLGVGAPSVSGPSFVAPSFEGAPSLGSLGSFGPKFESVAYTPIDSPIGRGEIQNMVSYKLGMFNPVGEINFNPKPVDVEAGRVNEPLSVASVLTEAESIIVQARDLTPVVKNPPIVGNLTTGYPILDELSLPVPEPRLQPNLIGIPLIEPEVRVGSAVDTGVRLQTNTDSNPGTNDFPAPAPALQEQEVEQTVEELVTEREQEKPEISNQTEQLEMGKRFIVDQIVLERRTRGIKEAVKKAKELALESGLIKISGKLINKFWNGGNPDYLSQPVYPQGPDGSIPEIQEEIGSKEFASEQEAEKAAVSIVNSKEPIKEGKTDQEGPVAEQKTVNRVFKFQLIKPHAIYKEVIKRVTKKVHSPVGQAPVVSLVEPDLGSKPETSLEQLNPDLAEVFQKGA